MKKAEKFQPIIITPKKNKKDNKKESNKKFDTPKKDERKEDDKNGAADYIVPKPKKLIRQMTLDSRNKIIDAVRVTADTQKAHLNLVVVGHVDAGSYFLLFLYLQISLPSSFPYLFPSLLPLPSSFPSYLLPIPLSSFQFPLFYSPYPSTSIIQVFPL